MEKELSIRKRRKTRACDRCRIRKIRCNYAAEQGNHCSNCIVVDVECTYNAPTKKRGQKPKPITHAEISTEFGSPEQDDVPLCSNFEKRKNSASYVASLKRRAEKLERTIKELNPNAILPERRTIHVLGMSLQGESSQPTSSTLSETLTDDEDLTYLDLGEKMKNLSLKHDKAFSERCFGSSSSVALFISALSTKKKLTGSLNTMHLQDYSNLYPWERATADAEKSRYVFPDNDLIMNLVAIYFETINPILPVLHRPTFTEDVANGLHLRDESFGATLLIVLAVASRYSDDPRVLADPNSRLSAGWRFIIQAPIFKKAVLAPPGLYEIQKAAIGVIHSLGTSVPQFSWTVIGIGLRAATEIGLHRKKPKGHKMTIDDELKKRSFWALVILDRLISLFLGRPVMLQEEDFDLEPPIECDDEYWDIGPNREVHFCQPADKPSKIGYFNAQIRLSGIMSVVVRNLYSIKKGRDMLGLSEKEDQQIVADIDSSMNAWMNSIPDHLRWDPDNNNTSFFYQSAVLNNTYYMLQIHIHRPFLRTNSPLSEPSLVISTTAARSCTRIHQVFSTRIKFSVPYFLMGAFMSGAVLAMNIWSRKRAGGPPNADDLAGFQQCLATFMHAADTWNIAGRSLKIFKGMASVETASVLDSTSVPAIHPQEIKAPVGAPIWSPYTAADVTPEQVQQFDTDSAYLVNYLATHPTGELPLDQTNKDSSSSFQSSSFDIAEPLLSDGVGTIDLWSYAPPGFSFAEWDAYVTNMGHF
ncbi:fungal-specific transcription factor domain-containing protein [Armillaria novae-zelandiae]|uniref:Fungal-specific transcription factor domain-containing protein n=1 Tax=Armillaria novae-zelandiae TaxID=153914 RepID=A0AA39TDT3_9AGAR|nr:fungal-specific transcription factor domain-containing protein [Armillaria novae-zelandiae]